MTIAVDFDDTLKIDGQPNIALIRELNRAKRGGAVLILWTCRAGASLQDALSFCGRYGLRFDFVNDNSPAVVKKLGYNPRKVLADVYIDDKAWR